jgi:hypothetical protein
MTSSPDPAPWWVRAAMLAWFLALVILTWLVWKHRP